MTPKITEIRSRTIALAKHPRTHKIAIWVVSIVIAIGILGGLVAPPLLRGKLASILSEKLHRQVSLQQIRINPYAMSVTLRGFLMKERQGSATAVSFDELYLNLELRSLFQWGLAIKEIRLVKPYIHVVRNEDRTYSFQDLIDEFTSGPSGPTPRFSLNNIEVVDGRIDFDDRPEQTQHTISSIQIGVPFISSLPSYTDIRVKPAFSALVNGALVQITGDSTPFKDTHESTIRLNIDKLQIPKYLEYSPVKLNFTVPSGEIDGKVSASFRTFKDKPSVLSIAGNIELKDLVMTETDKAPILNLPALNVVVDDFDVFANKAGLKAIKAQGPELHLTRNRDGTLNLTSLVAVNGQEKATEPKKPTTPFSFRVDDIQLDQGKLIFTDRGPEQPFQKQLENIHISVKGLSNDPEKKAQTELSFQTDAQEKFNERGTFQLTPLSAEGKVQLEGFQLKGLRPYYESLVGVEIREGLLDLTTAFGLEQNGKTQETKLSELNATLRSLRLDIPGESKPLWRAPLLALKDTTVDVGKKAIVIGSFEARNANGSIDREPDGTINYARLVKAQASESKAAEPAKEEPWRVDAKQLVLDRIGIVFEDRSLPTPARVTVSDLSARVENFSNAKNTPGKATIRARINNKGLLKLVGTAGTNPVSLKFDVEGQGIDLVPFQPYLENQVNFILTSGQLGTKGKLNFDASSAGPAKIDYGGNLQLTDFATVEKDGSQDLLKWKSLALDGLQLGLEPMRLRINEITLSDFYSRVIIGADGKINLQKLMAEKTGNPEAPGKSASTESAAPAASASAPAEKQVSIGKINLQGGNINFSDFFIKPNYSANLTDVQGTVAELKPDAPGDLAIQAKLDGAAPVDIRGKINPLSKDLFLDIVANAKDIELSPFSPYSGRYVGYGIEKGKLSFNVNYKIDNRKLTAENQIILNQLTFGEKVESPDATSLPVTLAVALLKDRNGVIDVNLPISGSLDDPQFSVGGIVLKIILNIITKAVTAPFALLGSMFGGGGEELSYIEFDYGRATLTPSAEAKIKTLAAAMNNRPALTLEISGRVDPVNDLEGLKKVSIERKVKAEKFKELVRQGNAPKSVDDVRVEKDEYERFLKAAYGDESFPKPRNLIGLAKDLPVPEMESLMLKYTKVTDDDLRELASRRAQVVRDSLLATGQVTGDRLFIVAAKQISSEDKEAAKAKESRVDFALK